MTVAPYFKQQSECTQTDHVFLFTTSYSTKYEQISMKEKLQPTEMMRRPHVTARFNCTK